MSALILLAAAAFADEKDAESCLRTKVWDGYAQGWGVRTMTSTAIPDGRTRNYLVTLYEGNEYRIRPAPTRRSRTSTCCCTTRAGT